MKKPFLLSASLLSLGLITAIYAQTTTTGGSIVDKMKAAAHSFSLSSVLNPTDTGLTSDPIKGKKTGDMLTAGEWNRVLELVSEGGSGGGSGWADVPLTGTENFDASCMYRVLITGDTIVRYASGVYSDQLFFGYNLIPGWIGGYVQKATKATFSTNSNGNFTVNKLEKLCGGGATTAAGGTVQITEGGIIKTSAKTISNWDLITLEGSWNSGGGDAAPTGGYIYKLGGQAKLSYVEASGINKDITLTTTAQLVHNLSVKLSGDSVVIDPSSTNTLAYIVWKFTGGTGSSPSSCPSGFVAVGSYCIEPTMSPKGKTWYEAGVACADKGAQLCQWSEWAIACKKGKLTDVQFGTTNGVYEWIDDYTGDAYQGIADPRVYSSCEYLSRADPKGGTTPVANIAYRCCTAQK